MSNDEFKALAKEVEEVGELVHQLEVTNPYIIPALFEVPHGQWRGWSGLENFRNTLVHHFRSISPEELLNRVKYKLLLHEVAALLENVTSVAMMSESLDFGSVSLIRDLPPRPGPNDLLPGDSDIVLRFHESGELLAVRSWRDEKDNWRASFRWVRTQAEDDRCIWLGISDTELMLTPQPTSPRDTVHVDVYNIFSVPGQPYMWRPDIIGQKDTSLVRKKK